MSVFPDGVQPFDDIVAPHVGLHMLVHRPGDSQTPCGERMDLMQPRFGAYLAEGYAARWCESCFPHENAWEQIVEAAFPEPARPVVEQRRDVFPVVNRAHRGLLARLHFGGHA